MNFKKTILAGTFAALTAITGMAGEYVPTAENLKSRQEFADAGFGIFLHWGLYSMIGQGEWFLNYGVNAEEYAKTAKAFYPADFNAKDWVSAIKASGAKYICFTTRHHDGFSMWGTKQSPYNVVDGTPFGRDILAELAEECHKQGIRLHLYYSHIDWTRPDCPRGRTGLETGRDDSQINWPKYYDFMNAQLTELLTNYGPIGAIWFDGKWDHDQDTVPFNWQLDEQYAMIHKLQPACLIGNNHHEDVIAGEDIQIFERDVPGQNTAGYSEQEISKLPLETCQTMNNMWGYRIKDQNYKTVDQLIQYLVHTAGQGANLLMNIGPQPNGELPAAALDRLKGIGEWMNMYGETIYATTAGPFPAQEWGTTTRRGDTVYVHILDGKSTTIHLPLENEKVVSAKTFDGRNVKFQNGDYLSALKLDETPTGPDYIVVLKTKPRK